jgi:hypothetical protein
MLRKHEEALRNFRCFFCCSLCDDEEKTKKEIRFGNLNEQICLHMLVRQNDFEIVLDGFRVNFELVLMLRWLIGGERVG